VAKDAKRRRIGDEAARIHEFMGLIVEILGAA
jgi:hypothetical protein